VPLETVFEKESRTVVYLENRDEREVEVGRRSDMEMEILTGLESGGTICLADPTLDEPTLPGDRATQPELNEGRKPPKRPSGGRRGRKGH